MTNTQMMQSVQAPANAVAMGTTRQQAYASAAQSIGDPFAAIIAQMLAQAQQGGEAPSALDSLEGPLMQDDETDAEKQKQMLEQGAAGILQMQTVQSSALLGEILDDTGDAPEAIGAAGTATGDAAQELAALAMQMSQNTAAGLQSISTVPQEVLEAMLQKNAGSAQPAVQQPLPAEDGQAATQLGAVPVEITVQQTAPGSAQSGEADTAFSQLMQGEAQTAQPTKAQPAEDSGKTKASEAFSQELAADAAKEPTHAAALSETQMAKAEGLAREPELLQQLEKTVNQTLSSGKQELTMKLKPEALGEITVRLVEREGKMTLDITAANAQTAKLINSDLTALREAVRPMNVEVHEAVQQSGNTSQGTAQYDLFGQQFSGQQQFANQQAWQQAAARSARRSDSFEDAVQQVGEVQTQPAAATLLSELDTYV